MRKPDGEIRIPQFWMISAVVFFQALWNPVVVTISTLQFYLATVLLFLLFTLKLLFRKRDFNTKWVLDTFPLWSYFGYSLIFLLSVLIHGLNQFAIGNFARISSLVLMLVFIQNFSLGFERIVRLYFVFNCCLSLILIFSLIESGIDISNRISPAGQGSANCFGATLGLVLLLRLSLHEAFSKFENRIVYLFGIPVTFLAILGTYSRGATLGFVLGLLLLGMQKIRISHIPKILGFCSLILILTELAGFSQFPTMSRYSSKSFQDSSGRTIIFQNALEAFSKNPLFGNGVGSKLNPYSSGEASAHNVLLQVLGETGLLGLLLLILLLAVAAKRFNPKISAPALGCIFIVSLTDNHFLAVQFHLTVGLMYLSLIRDSKRGRKVSNNEDVSSV